MPRDAQTKQRKRPVNLAAGRAVLIEPQIARRNRKGRKQRDQHQYNESWQIQGQTLGREVTQTVEETLKNLCRFLVHATPLNHMPPRS